MKIKREALLKTLESVSPGIAEREGLEQSSCFVFHDGAICAFNGEIACRAKSPLNGVEGAVEAKPLLVLLSKLGDDLVDVSQGEKRLHVSAPYRKADFLMEQDISLPIQDIESPHEWHELPTDFEEAVDTVESCASSEESDFLLTCIHLHPEFLEASDRYQIARYPVKMPISSPILVRADALRKIVGLGMTRISDSGAWLHFGNNEELVLSCRKNLDTYFNLDEYLRFEASAKIHLPNGLDQVVDRARDFAKDNAMGDIVEVDLRRNKLVIKGEGPTRRYKEMKEVKYDGPAMRFLIASKLLIELVKKTTDCKLGQGCLFADTGKFSYITRTELKDKENQNVESVG